MTMEVRMNAELPAFDKTLEDKAFAAALEEDGLPPLYPNQPRWAFEDGHGAEREAFAQRRSDAAFAHVKLLARRHRGKTQPPGDWRALLATAGLRPSEPTHKIFKDPKTPISVDAFMGELVRTNQLAFGPDAGANVPPEARCCDRCGAVTPCVCACGVSFCSRACLKEAWPEHAPSCAVVFKNGPAAYTTLNEREFGDARGPAERPISESCAHCGVRGATSRCSRCRRVVYCGRACQAAAWGRHRKLCK